MTCTPPTFLRGARRVLLRGGLVLSAYVHGKATCAEAVAVSYRWTHQPPSHVQLAHSPLPPTHNCACLSFVVVFVAHLVNYYIRLFRQITGHAYSAIVTYTIAFS